MLKFFGKNKENLIVFILFLFLSAPYFVDICSGYLSYSYFDLQEFLLWDYTSINQLIPYRDIFYPYGLFNYFKSINPIYAFIYYLVSPFLFTLVFFLFRTVFKEKFIAYYSIGGLYLFVLIIVGFQTFIRYGLLAFISLLFSYIFFYKKVKTYTLIYFGVVLGLFFFLVNDIGFYLVFSFIFIFLFNKLIQNKKDQFWKTSVIKSFNQLLCVILGFLIGLMPWFLFLLALTNFSAFFEYFKDVREIAIVAKTPFFSFIDSASNVFTLSILYFSIFYSFIKLYFFKKKVVMISIFQIVLIFVILVMEQKSVIRSMDRQITFIALTLLMFLTYDLVVVFKTKDAYKKIVYAFFIMVLTVLYYTSVDKRVIDFSFLSKNINFIISNKCFDNNLKFFSDNNPSYIKIINLLKDQKKFNGKIFSFPTGDSAFYVLLNQKPPFYNAIFEGSSYAKQNSTIKYIQDNKIEYITLNTNKSSIQDSVPDFIRQGHLFSYILVNYYPFEAVGSHLILKKTENTDFFDSEVLGGLKDYKNYLLDIHLYKIPYSEGLYKYNSLKNNNRLIRGDDIAKINSFLEKTTFYSTKKVLVLVPRTNYKSNDSSLIRFETQNGYWTSVSYDSCGKGMKCVINLSRIPLFYKERVVKKIILDKKFKGDIEIFDFKKEADLW